MEVRGRQIFQEFLLIHRVLEAQQVIRAAPAARAGGIAVGRCLGSVRAKVHLPGGAFQGILLGVVGVVFVVVVFVVVVLLSLLLLFLKTVGCFFEEKKLFFGQTELFGSK